MCRLGFPLSCNFYVRTLVNEIESMYERSRAKVKVEQGSNFTFTRDLPYIASILSTHLKFTRQWKSTLMSVKFTCVNKSETKYERSRVIKVRATLHTLTLFCSISSMYKLRNSGNHAEPLSGLVNSSTIRRPCFLRLKRYFVELQPRKNMIPFELRRAMINVTSLDSFFQSLSFGKGYINSLRNDISSLNQGKNRRFFTFLFCYIMCKVLQ